MVNFHLRIRTLVCIAGLLPIFFSAQPGQAAETQYVSDILIVTLRQAPDNASKIIRTLKTDTPLEILEEQGRYLRARTQDGDEGWVLAQYISPKTPKATIIAKQKKELDQLSQQLADLQTRHAQLTESMQTIQAQYDSTLQELNIEKNKSHESMSATQDQLEQMTEQYNTLVSQSTHVVELKQENETLLATNNKLSREAEYLRQENTHLKRSGTLKWFLAGGGVFLAGLIGGRIGPRKKKMF